MKLDFAQIKYISLGIIVTLKYSILSVFFGLFVASFIVYCAYSKFKILNYFNKFYVSIFRGTPLIVQLSLVYFGLPGVTGIKMTALIGGVITFSLNSGAYVSEILRAGINSIDKGQWEAAHSLGISKFLTVRDIILPQVLKNVTPSLLNEFIDMVKESSLISIISEADLMSRSQLVAAEKYTYFAPVMIAACNYYFLVMLLTYLITQIEKKWLR